MINTTKSLTKRDSLDIETEFQFSLRARYEWGIGSGRVAHFMPHATYSDASYSDIITINRAKMDDWLMLGFTAGVTADNWSAEFFAENITDETAEISRSFIYDRHRSYYARPFTGGIRLTYDF